MKFTSYIVFFLSFLIAENKYCHLNDKKIQLDFSHGREYYNIGDTISDEDQSYPYSVCHSDGNYETGSNFRLSDYAGDIILISMNATW